MFDRRCLLPGIVAVFVAGAAPGAVAGQQQEATQDELDFVRSVASEVYGVAPAVVGRAYGLDITMERWACDPHDRENDLAACTDGVTINVTPRFLRERVQGNADLLAFVIGHELGHAALGHRKSGDGIVGLAAGRQDEVAADSLGVLLALRAGYSLRGISDGLLDGSDIDRSPFQALVSSHPSWVDRAAFAASVGGDGLRAILWRSMAQFQDGVFFLSVAQYPLAEQAFLAVVSEFDDAYDAWANLGYARLMMYCDGLTADELKALRVGEVVVGGAFYTRSGYIEEQLRLRGAPNVWQESVDALRNALDRAEQRGIRLTLARANLGVAYLLSPFGQPVLGEAIRHLETAVEQVVDDPSVDTPARAAVMINAAVAAARSGNAALADTRLRQAGVAAGSVGSPVSNAIRYNRAYMAAGGGVTDRAATVRDLEDYLNQTTPGSAWWDLAYDMYADLVLDAPPRDLYRERVRIDLGPRPVVSVHVDGRTVRLNEEVAALVRAFPPTARRRLLPAGERLLFGADGFEVLTDGERVTAIVVRTSNILIPYQERVLGAAVNHLRVGMSSSELRQALGDWNWSMGREQVHLFGAERKYDLFRSLGVAFLISDDGRLEEVVVVRAPA